MASRYDVAYIHETRYLYLWLHCVSAFFNNAGMCLPQGKQDM